MERWPKWFKKIASYTFVILIVIVLHAPIPGGSEDPEWLDEYLNSEAENTKSNADSLLNPEILNIDPRAALSSNERVVYNYAELKDALSNDNGITTVYFGNDITMQETGIRIHPGKTNIIVNGINPLDPVSTYYTLTDYSSTVFTDTIYIDAAGPKTLLVRNLIIIGKNYYGPFSIYDSSDLSELVVTYDRVSYYGPQLGYHRNGLIRISNCSLTVAGANGQEFSEAKNLIFEGTNYIANGTSKASIFWHPQGGTFKIANGASLTLTASGTSSTYGLFYAGGSSYNVDIDIGERAAFDVTISGVVAPTERATLKSVTVQEGGTFNLKTTKTATEAVLAMGGNLTVERGATFIINGYGSTSNAGINQNTGDITINKDATFQIIASGPYPRLINLYGRALICNDPARVLLYNTSRDIEATTSAGRVYINAQQINYWNAVTAGGLDEPALYSWEKADKSNFWIDGALATGSSGILSSLSSNYTAGDLPDVQPSAATFNMTNARVLAFGRLELLVTAPSAKSTDITGVTAPGATVRVSFSQQGVNYTLPDVTADTKGVFHINAGVSLRALTVITVKSNYRYLTATTQITVSGSGALEFAVPEKMNFFNTKLSTVEKFAKRLDPDWHIVVSDTRGTGGEWNIYARLVQPLTPPDNTRPALTNALVFADNSITPLTSDRLLIYHHISASDNEVVKIHWAEDRGILIQVPVDIAYSGLPYTAIIEWSLVDAP